MTDATSDANYELEVAMSLLSEQAQQQVHEAVHYASESHALESLDVREVIDDAAAADAARAEAEDYQREQAKAADAGDWDTAHEYAQKAQQSLETVADHGGSDVPAAQAEADVSQLDNARWEQRTANENASAAASYAAAGDGATAQIYSDAAGSHQDAADDSGHSGTSAAHEATDDSSSSSTPEHAPDADAGAASAAADPTPPADHPPDVVSE